VEEGDLQMTITICTSDIVSSAYPLSQVLDFYSQRKVTELQIEGSESETEAHISLLQGSVHSFLRSGNCQKFSLQKVALDRDLQQWMRTTSPATTLEFDRCVFLSGGKHLLVTPEDGKKKGQPLSLHFKEGFPKFSYLEAAVTSGKVKNLVVEGVEEKQVDWNTILNIALAGKTSPVFDLFKVGGELQLPFEGKEGVFQKVSSFDFSRRIEKSLEDKENNPPVASSMSKSNSNVQGN
jgi:hypothetical protein